MKKTKKTNIKITPKEANKILQLEMKDFNSTNRLVFSFEPMKPSDSMFKFRKEVNNDRNNMDN